MSKQPNNDVIIRVIAACVVLVALPILLWPSSESAQTLTPVSDRAPTALVEGATTTQKSRGPLTAHLTGHKISGEINLFDFSAEIDSKVDLEKMSLDWTLPNGSELLEGHSQASFENMRPSQKKLAKIRVRLPNADNHKIYVSVQATNGKQKFGLVDELESEKFGKVNSFSAPQERSDTKIIY